MPHPILSNEQLAAIRHMTQPGWSTETIDTTWPRSHGAAGMRKALDRVCREAEKAVDRGETILLLSDREVREGRVAIPMLLAVGAVHQHLVKTNKRTRVGLVVETGEAREVHHHCLLIGYGADAINPYLAFEALWQARRDGLIEDVEERAPSEEESGEGADHPAVDRGGGLRRQDPVTAADEDLVAKYRKGVAKGMLKVMAKMGISTLQSYKGAQIFEALGLRDEVVELCFTGTASRVQGVGFEVLAEEAIRRHALGLPRQGASSSAAGAAQPGRVPLARRGRTPHVGPQVDRRHPGRRPRGRPGRLPAVRRPHQPRQPHALPAARPAGAEAGRERRADPDRRGRAGEGNRQAVLHRRHVVRQHLGRGARVARHRDEPPGRQEQHRRGGRGPGPLDARPNGDSRRSAIKQVASGRFGVTISYLTNADEIQIKISQGAKPGEGGELPGRKVDENIARIRYSTPGVGLISPPPHHDIYSIEDLAQLIYDLKNANRAARISVKLVSEVGVGTIAAGVVKGHADHVLISGDGGGTGASPLTSIKHAGLPWEIGIAETHQTLMANDLRSRVVLQTDGGLKTGRDVVIAALLGAEEFGFSTAPLITLGCIMMRKCHLNTCPVGIATQDPDLRKMFRGKPEHVVNYLFMVAEEARTADGGARLPHHRRDGRPARRAGRHQGDPALEGGRARPDGAAHARPPPYADAGAYCTRAGPRAREDARPPPAARPREAGARVGQAGHRERCRSSTRTGPSARSCRTRSPSGTAKRACPTARSTSSSTATPARASARSSRTA